MTRSCYILGAPVESGARPTGCQLGPAAMRMAGLPEILRSLAWEVTDLGEAQMPTVPAPDHPNKALRNLGDTIAWTQVLTAAAYEAAKSCDRPIFLGGDHSLSAGTVVGLAKHAGELGRPLFVLWLDAHPDFHTLDSTTSGNLNGTPAAYFTGQAGFDGFPEVPNPVKPKDLCMLGLRSIDKAERERLLHTGVELHDMRAIDVHGITGFLRSYLRRVAEANGLLHLSLDVDFLDPSIAPAVSTTVPGGATLRQAQLIMELLHESGLVTSLDLAELNPLLDDRGRTAHLLTDLSASLFGRAIHDRPSKTN